MHDPRPHTAIRELLKVISECVGKRAGKRAGRRMDHEPSGFIYDHQRLVFINDLERNIFRREEVRRRRDQLNFNLVMLAKFVGWLRDFPVYEYIFILDQPLQARAAPAFKLRSEVNIKTTAGMFWSNPCSLWITHCAVQNLS